MGFLEGFGADFPQKDVVIVHDAGTPKETRTPSRAIIQGRGGQFNVDTPIFEGDTVEVADPRGGLQRLYAAEVRVNDVDHAREFAGMGHINVRWGKPPVASDSSPVIQVSGGSNQFAWGNRDVTQEQTTAPADLRDALALILAGVHDHVPFGEEREIIEESAREALSALDEGKEPPRRLLATIKGMLGDVAAGAGRGLGTAAAGWASQALSGLG